MTAVIHEYLNARTYSSVKPLQGDMTNGQGQRSTAYNLTAKKKSDEISGAVRIILRKVGIVYHF